MTVSREHKARVLAHQEGMMANKARIMAHSPDCPVCAASERAKDIARQAVIDGARRYIAVGHDVINPLHDAVRALEKLERLS